MSVHDAIANACAAVGIIPPRNWRAGKWIPTDTLDGKRGKGDGRLIVNEAYVTAYNWRLAQSATVRIDDDTPATRRQFANAVQADKQKSREKAERAAHIARAIVEASKAGTHSYLASKGFREETALTIGAKEAGELAGSYLVTGERAVVVPARKDGRIVSVQLIWEDGTKKFLAGGEIGGASYRIATGADTWLCEGFATGLSLRAALKALRLSATVLVAFTASNIATVARTVKGRCFVVADNDSHKPQNHFGGLGTGEWFARQFGHPYVMPPVAGQDLNDMHKADGIFAVQRLIASFLREARSR